MAHLLHHEKYFNHYKNIDGYKILDNGAAEGSLVTAQELLDWAKEIGANEIVVPDMVGNYRETADMLYSFESIAYKHPEFKYVGVAQGRNIGEVLACLNAIDYSGFCSVLALPRHLLNIHPQERYFVASSIPEMHKGARFDGIHCLGAGKWTREVAVLTELPLVRGIDTSMPIVLGLEGIKLSESTDYVSRQENYLEVVPDERQLELIYDNIETYLGWAAAPSSSELRNLSSE